MKPPTKSSTRDARRVADVDGVAEQVAVHGAAVPRWRRRPGAAGAQLLPGAGQLQHAQVVEAPAGDLQADRQAAALVQPQFTDAAGCSLMLYGSVNAMCSNGRWGRRSGSPTRP